MLGIWVPSSFDPRFNRGSPVANTNNDVDNASDNFWVDQAKNGHVGRSNIQILLWPRGKDCECYYLEKNSTI
jgi:hypothetical protein